MYTANNDELLIAAGWRPILSCIGYANGKIETIRCVYNTHYTQYYIA